MNDALLFSYGSWYVGFQWRCDKEARTRAQCLNFIFDGGQLAHRLRLDQNTQDTSNRDPGLTSKIPSLLLVDQKHRVFNLDCQRDRFSFTFVKIAGQGLRYS